MNERTNIADLLVNVLEATLAALHKALDKAGHADIRPVHAAVFRTIGEGSRVADMARSIQMTKQAMSELVAYLEERGYVERVPDPTDGRARIVKISAKGEESGKVVEQAFAAYERSWAKHLGRDGVADLRRLLEQLQGALERDWSQHLVRAHFTSREQRD
jgi:DNA-binding MarR family transcriptional regulator